MDPEAHALVGAYALDAMDGPQRQRFEAHLEDCEACRTEVAELQATAALLGQAAEAVPPAGMRSRVLDAVDTIRQDAPAVPVGRGPVRVRGKSRLQPVFVAAAAVLTFAVVLFGSLYAQTSARLNRLEDVVAADTVEDDLLTVLSAPDTQVTDVTVSVGGSARFVWSGERQVGVLVGDRLREAPEGRTSARS
jgi:anti-sigma factor RsiW